VVVVVGGVVELLTAGVMAVVELPPNLLVLQLAVWRVTIVFELWKEAWQLARTPQGLFVRTLHLCSLAPVEWRQAVLLRELGSTALEGRVLQGEWRSPLPQTIVCCRCQHAQQVQPPPSQD